MLIIAPDEKISARNLEVLFGCQNTEIAEITRGINTQINSNETPTFDVFVSGKPFTFSPGVNRMYVRFRDSEGVVRGSTSAALRFGN